MLENDSVTYRKMCEPFASVEEANAAAQAFGDELYELRVKHRMKDVLFAIESAIAGKDGESHPIIYGYFGDVSNAERIASYTLGRLAGGKSESVGQWTKGCGTR